MKRLLFGLAFVGGFGVCVAATKHLVPTDVVRGEVARAFASVVGAPLVLAGDVEISVLPTLKVRFRDARFARVGSVAPIAEMRELVVRLDVLPLLTGRVSVSEIALREPVVRIDRPLTLEALTPDRQALAAAEPVRLTVEGGRLLLVDPAGHRSERLDRIDAQVVWPRARSGISLEANFRWRGEAVAIAAQGLGPRDLAAGEVGPASLSITAAPLKVSFQGKGVLVDRLQLDGQLTATTPNFGRLVGWLGSGGDGAPLPREVAIEGRMRSLGFAATVSDSVLTIDGNRGDGVVSARLDAPRPQVRGTLAFDTIDFDRIPPSGALDWRSLPTDQATVAAADLDLRLSAGVVRSGPFRLERVAATLLAKNGRFDAEIGEARLFGGSLTTVLRGEPAAGGLHATGRIVASDFDAGAVGAAAGMAAIESGRLGATLEGEATGATLGALVDRLAGHLGAEAKQIALKGADAGSTVPLLRAQPIALRTPVAARVTSFDRAVLDVDITGRLALVRRLEAQGAALSARLSGEASLATGLLSLGGEMSVGDRSAETRGLGRRTTTAIRIGGTIARPLPYVVAPETTPDLGQPY